jgi:hypothetical protein
MAESSLSTYTVAQLTQMYQSNRASVIQEIVRHVHATIVEFVSIGKRDFTVDHMYLHSDWLQDATFRSELETTIQAYFPGSTIALVLEEPRNYCISFSYTPL